MNKKILEKLLGGFYDYCKHDIFMHLVLLKRRKTKEFISKITPYCLFLLLFAFVYTDLSYVQVIFKRLHENMLKIT